MEKKSLPHVCCSAQQQLSLSKLQQVENVDFSVFSPSAKGITKAKLEPAAKYYPFEFVHFVVPALCEGPSGATLHCRTFTSMVAYTELNDEK